MPSFSYMNGIEALEPFLSFLRPPEVVRVNTDSNEVLIPGTMCAITLSLSLSGRTSVSDFTVISPPPPFDTNL